MKRARPGPLPPRNGTPADKAEGVEALEQSGVRDLDPFQVHMYGIKSWELTAWLAAGLVLHGGVAGSPVYRFLAGFSGTKDIERYNEAARAVARLKDSTPLWEED